MIISILIPFLVAFVITCISELFICFLAGYREKKELISVILINLISNPLINYVIILLSTQYFFRKYMLLIILSLEIIVVLLEWSLLVYSFKPEKIREMFFLSFGMNLLSFLIGYPLGLFQLYSI